MQTPSTQRSPAEHGPPAPHVSAQIGPVAQPVEGVAHSMPVPRASHDVAPSQLRVQNPQSQRSVVAQSLLVSHALRNAPRPVGSSPEHATSGTTRVRSLHMTEMCRERRRTAQEAPRLDLATRSSRVEAPRDLQLVSRAKRAATQAIFALSHDKS
jgi:hypothetical protein